MVGRDEPSVVDLPNNVLNGLEGEVSDPEVAGPVFQGHVNVSINVASPFGGGPNNVVSILGGRPDDNTREFPTPFFLDLQSIFRRALYMLTSVFF